MHTRFRSLALLVLSCTFTFLVSPVFLCELSGQEYGPPHQVLMNGDPATPTLVEDPAERFDAAQAIMKGNHPTDRVTNPSEIACFLPPLSRVHSATVSVDKLASQAKASPEYEKACSAIASKKFDSAEKHIQKALEKFPDYSALWVLLGQLQENANQMPAAHESCLHASVISSAFVPAYLCLADIAFHNQDWKEVLKQSERALTLDPATNAISYMYNAGANFNLHHITGAERSALLASKFPGSDIDPRQLHFLLAQIYEAKGDVANEMAQLKEFLRVAGNSKEAEAVKQYLAKLGSSPDASGSREHTAK